MRVDSVKLNSRNGQEGNLVPMSPGEGERGQKVKLNISPARFELDVLFDPYRRVHCGVLAGRQIQEATPTKRDFLLMLVV